MIAFSGDRPRHAAGAPNITPTIARIGMPRIRPWRTLVLVVSLGQKLQRSADMNFQVSGLPVKLFAHLFGLPDAGLATQDIVRHTADTTPGFPCRVSLRDAEPGETVLLLNFEHLAVASPYRSRYAIYVREHAEEARVAINSVPDVLRRRLLSARAFDARGMLLDADVVDGGAVEGVIERMLAKSEVEYLHLHNAKPGCWAARVDRV
jgi:hypothetical protein